MRIRDTRGSWAHLGLLLFLLPVLPMPARACEECYAPWFAPANLTCRVVRDGVIGVTQCDDDYDPISRTYWCSESGNYCESITVVGSGGGGGGGSCVTTGFCPAWCFSCSPPRN